MDHQSILRNVEEGRLRAVWRIAIIQFLFWAAFLGLEAFSIRITDPWLETHGPLGMFIRYRYLHVIRAALTVSCLCLAAKCVDRRPFAEFGFYWDRTWCIQFATGFAVGLGVVSFRHLLAIGVGAERIAETAHAPSGIPFSLDLISAVAAMCLLGLTEEGMTRAHPMINLAEGLGDKPSAWLLPTLIMIPAFGFALVHSINGGDYWINAIFFLTCFGVIFGCIYYIKGSLAVPIGLHAAWDLGNIFLFRLTPSRDCYLFRLEPISGGHGSWIPNDNLYLILLMAATLIWLVRITSRPEFRSPLLMNSSNRYKGDQGDAKSESL